MEVEVSIKSVVTRHNPQPDGLDNPLIDVTFEVNKTGSAVKHELLYCHQLSDFVGKTDQQILSWFKAIAKEVISQALAGQETLDPDTSEWKRLDVILGQTFNLTI